MNLPLILEVGELQKYLSNKKLTIVDLSPYEQYLQGHIPGAIHLDSKQLIKGGKPAPGLMPDDHSLSKLFSSIGLTAQTHIVCYDNEGGPWAGRLIWTLESIGHHRYSFLNGGIHAWQQAGLPLEQEAHTLSPSHFSGRINHMFTMTLDDILTTLKKSPEQLLIWDARSLEEYNGTKALAAKGGHIPGAIHCEWSDLVDQENGYRIRADVRQFLLNKGITPDKTVVTHCQTHRRSGLTWLVAFSLGYPSIKAYPGSWSEWGNHPETPVEKTLP